MEECDQNVWNVFNQFDITISSVATYLVEVGARVSLKVVTKGSPRGKKKHGKFGFLGYFFNAKGARPKIWSLFSQFDITIPSSVTYFLEVGVHLSLKVPTKGSPRGKTYSEIWDF